MKYDASLMAFDYQPVLEGEMLTHRPLIAGDWGRALRGRVNEGVPALAVLSVHTRIWPGPVPVLAWRKSE
jgi:hypothetical protein